ncbi:distal tail protein Dit [Bacillus sp. COPE52]|uniref:distal tail protein Dit n=1 Tax=Bacillus sp. COPE52 TaxID=2233998 RepID=UPI000E109089|nr:distal tail protein Dit [Bacillus sp. COPE52]AXK19121.1 hypothetical protein DPQ31_16045 [Bacillus sp. COPE52]
MVCSYTQLCLEKNDHFSLGGELSSDYGLVSVGERDFSAPSREVKKVKVLGQDGDLIIDQKRYNNFTRKIDGFMIVSDYRELAAKVKVLRNWLNKTAKYQELIFSYDEESVYMASHSSEVQAVMISPQIAQVSIEFDLKPEIFTPYSFMSAELTSSDTLINEFSVKALPYIKITGNGDMTLHINNRSYNYKGVDGWIEIDSQLKIVYKKENGVISNRSEKAVNRNFPYFEEGENNVSWTGSITKVEIVPRWRSR